MGAGGRQTLTLPFLPFQALGMSLLRHGSWSSCRTPTCRSQFSAGPVCASLPPWPLGPTAEQPEPHPPFLLQEASGPCPTPVSHAGTSGNDAATPSWPRTVPRGLSTLSTLGLGCWADRVGRALGRLSRWCRGPKVGPSWADIMGFVLQGPDAQRPPSGPQFPWAEVLGSPASLAVGTRGIEPRRRPPRRLRDQKNFGTCVQWPPGGSTARQSPSAWAAWAATAQAVRSAANTCPSTAYQFAPPRSSQTTNSDVTSSEKASRIPSLWGQKPGSLRPVPGLLGDFWASEDSPEKQGQ